MREGEGLIGGARQKCNFAHMQLFYFPDTEGDTVELNSAEARHLVKVLRRKAGDEVRATDGRGTELTARLTLADVRRAVLEITQRVHHPRQHPLLTLAVAPTKSMDRLEWLVEKATEIGIHRIVPMRCAHAERAVLKHERLERIAVAAMKQSLRFHLPEISPLVPFEAVLSAATDAQRFLCHLPADGQVAALQERLVSGTDAWIMVGPEGDFSAEELTQASAAGWEMVALGKARLRTETAALAAVHTFALTNPLNR